MIDFHAAPLWLNGVVFAITALVVWAAGTRLTRYADEISERTRFGSAFIGAILLGGITSLPELATTSTAALAGNASLAVNNILGGVAMQVAILALADAVIGEGGLSTRAGQPSLLLQGTGLMLALALAAGGMVAEAVVVLGVDLWTVAVFVLVVAVLAFIQHTDEHPYWRPTDEVDTGAPAEPAVGERDGGRAPTATRTLVAYIVGTGAVVIVSGYVLTLSAEALSSQTGLGAGFVGAIFLGAATSLPEVSTTVEAVRRRRYSLAFSNIFGTNLLDVGFLFLADLLYREGAVLAEVGDFSVFAALLGILLTGVYVVGILQRRKPVLLRMGIDSALVLSLYVVGAVVLYGLR